MKSKLFILVVFFIFFFAQIACGSSVSTSETTENILRNPWDVPTEVPASEYTQLVIEHGATFYLQKPSKDDVTVEALNDGVLETPSMQRHIKSPCEWDARVSATKASGFYPYEVVITGMLAIIDTNGKRSEVQVELPPSGDINAFRLREDIGSGGYIGGYRISIKIDDPNCTSESEIRAISRIVSIEVTNVEWDEKAGGLRDTWILSNPTDRPLSFTYTITRRDADDMFLEKYEGRGCPKYGSGWDVVKGKLIWIPPGKSVVIYQDLDAKRADDGVTQELSVVTLDKCSNADFFGRYDPDVIMDSIYDNNDGTATLIIKNDSSHEAVAGVLYLSVYTRDGRPLYGEELSDIGKDIPSGEKVKRTVNISTSGSVDFGDGKGDRYEYLLVALTD
jgi:hypothetical protein